jgi:hypothetical protein
MSRVKSWQTASRSRQLLTPTAMLLLPSKPKSPVSRI